MIEVCCENLSVWCIWLCVLNMSHTCFRVNLHSCSYLNVKELLAWNRCYILSDSNNQLVCKQRLNYKAKVAKWLSYIVRTYLYGTSGSVTNVKGNLHSVAVWISKRPMGHDKNIQSNATYRQVLTTQPNHLTSFAKWLNVCLLTKWSWVWISLKLPNL